MSASIQPEPGYHAYYNVRFAEIPRNMLVGAVAHLRANLDPEMVAQIKQLHAEHGPVQWIHTIPMGHHGFGTSVRNGLRTAKFTDDMLPAGNWDDYYIQVIEAACDLRSIPHDTPGKNVQKGNP